MKTGACKLDISKAIVREYKPKIDAILKGRNTYEWESPSVIRINSYADNAKSKITSKDIYKANVAAKKIAENLRKKIKEETEGYIYGTVYQTNMQSPYRIKLNINPDTIQKYWDQLPLDKKIINEDFDLESKKNKDLDEYQSVDPGYLDFLPSHIFLSPEQEQNFNDALEDYYTYLQSLNNLESENQVDAQKKIDMLSKAIPNAVIEYDYSMEEKGKVLSEKNKDGKIIIKINPSKFTTDTIIHEFAHILIDSYDKKSINNLINSLRDTDLWKEVKALYPELDEITLGKEVLATAIGLEGAKLYDKIRNPDLFNKIKEGINKILTRLARYLGLSPLTVKRFARDLLYNDFEYNINNFHIDLTYSSKTPQEKFEAFRQQVFLDDNHNYAIKDKNGNLIAGIEGTNISNVKVTSGTKFVKEIFPELDFDDRSMNIYILKNILPQEEIENFYTKDSNGKRVLVDKYIFDTLLNKVIEDYPHFDIERTKQFEEWDRLKNIGTYAHKYIEIKINDLLNGTNTPLGNLQNDLSQESIKELDKIITRIGTYVKKGYKVYTEQPIAKVKYNGNIPEKAFAGMIDLALVSPKGDVLIFDFKTYGSYNMSNDDAYNNYIKYKAISHAAQLNVYRSIIESYGYNVTTLQTIVLKREFDDLGEVKGFKILPKGLNAFTLNQKHSNGRFYTYNNIKNVVDSIIQDKIDDTFTETRRKINSLNSDVLKIAIQKLEREFSVQTNGEIYSLESFMTASAALNDVEYFNLLFKYLEEKIEDLKNNIAEEHNSGQTSKIITNIAEQRKQIAEYSGLLRALYSSIELKHKTDVDNNFITDAELSVSKDMLNKINGDLNSTEAYLIEKSDDILAKYIVDNTSIGMEVYTSKFNNEFEKLNPVVYKGKRAVLYSLLKPFVTFPIAILSTPTRYFGKSLKGKRYYNLLNFFNEHTYYLGNQKVTQSQYEQARKDYELNRYENMTIPEKTQMTAYRYETAKKYISSTPGLNGLFKPFAQMGDDRSSQDYFVRSLINDAEKQNQDIIAKVIDKQKQIEALLSGKVKIKNKNTYADYVDDKGNLVTKYSPEFMSMYWMQPKKNRNRWLLDNLIFNYNSNGDVVNVAPKKEWLDPKYNKIKDDPLYQLFVDLTIESDKLVPKNRQRSKSELEIDGEFVALEFPFIKLPSIPKSLNDAILESSLTNKNGISVILDQFKEEYYQRHSGIIVDDHANGMSNDEYLRLSKEQREEVDRSLSNMGNLRSDVAYIPKKHFRGRFGANDKEHGKRVSLNLASTFLADYRDALEYNFANSNGALIDTLVDAWTKGGTSKIIESSDNTKTVNKINHIRYEQVKNAISQRFYKIPPINDNPKLFAIINSTTKFFTSLAMAANANVSNQNMLQQELDIMLQVSNGEFNLDNMRNSDKFIADEFFATSTDNLTQNKQSRVNLLKDLFGITEHTDFNMDSKLRRGLRGVKDLATFRLLSNRVDQDFQSRFLITLLDTYKVQNEKGEYIDKNGVVVPKEKALGLQHFFERTEDSKNGIRTKNAYLKLSPLAVKTNKGEVDLNKIIAETRGKYYNYKRLVMGNNEARSYSLFRMTAIGQLTLPLRNWMAPGFERRFKNLNNISSFFAQLDKPSKYKEPEASHLIFFDDYHNRVYDGYYATFLKYLFSTKFLFMKNSIRNFTLSLMNKEANKIDTVKYKELSLSQKKDISMALQDISGLFLLYVLSNFAYYLILGGDDEEEAKIQNKEIDPIKWLSIKHAKIKMGQLLNKAYMERSSMNPIMFKNLFDTFVTDIVNDPSPTVKLIFDILDVDLLTEYERNNNKKGIKKGDLKLEHKWKNLIPIYRSYARDERNSYYVNWQSLFGEKNENTNYQD